jgi:hypothetical protein
MGAACAARLVGDVDVLILADRNAEAIASVTHECRRVKRTQLQSLL